MNEPRTWKEHELGALTLDEVKRLHQPAYKYRIQQHRYEPYTPFPSVGVARTYYVIAGACTVEIKSSGVECTIRPGQFLRVPEGECILSYPERTDIITVLELPSEVWPK